MKEYASPNICLNKGSIRIQNNPNIMAKQSIRTNKWNKN